MVFQNYALFPHMTVERNLSFGLRLRHTRGPERRERVAQVARLLRIEELLARFPRELSGGQKQRVALGRALIRQPVAFLFDEPLSNLDPALRVEMRAEIAQLHRDYPITTVYVTHDQVEAMTMGDRIAVMNHGRIRQVGDPSRVYHDPDDLFTASFIGSPALNQLPVAVEQDGDLMRFISADGGQLFVERNLLGVSGELPANAVLGIRPEHLSLCTPRDENALGAEVYLVEELGREHIVHLERGGRQLRAVGQLQEPPQLGELVHVRPTGRMFIFDAETEMRIR
jgi:ABC-type sugar transport system ATPase subunit